MTIGLDSLDAHNANVVNCDTFWLVNQWDNISLMANAFCSSNR